MEIIKKNELYEKIKKSLKKYIDDNFVQKEKDAKENEVGEKTYRLSGTFLSSKMKKTSSLRKSDELFEEEKYYDANIDNALNREELQEDKCLSEKPLFGAVYNANHTNDSLENRVNHISDTWQESLFNYIDLKGLDEVEVYKNAGIDRKLFSKKKDQF